ncbi:hypothetical protein JCM10207_004022 [Rhodosporidiobolus poonsookiae]
MFGGAAATPSRNLSSFTTDEATHGHPSSNDHEDDMFERFVLGTASPGVGGGLSLAGDDGTGRSTGRNKRKARTSDDLTGLGLTDDAGGAKKQKSGGGQGIFGDDDDQHGVSGFDGSLHDAFALTEPVVGGNSAGEHAGSGSGAGTAGVGASSLGLGDYNLPLGDMGAYGAGIDALEFANFLQTPAAVPAPLPAAEPVAPPPAAAGALDEHEPEELDEEILDDLPMEDDEDEEVVGEEHGEAHEAAGAEHAAPDHDDSSPVAVPIPGLDLHALDPSLQLQDIAASTIEQVQAAVAEEAAAQSRRTSQTDLEEIQQLLGYNAADFLPEEEGLDLPSSDSPPTAGGLILPALPTSHSHSHEQHSIAVDADDVDDSPALSVLDNLPPMPPPPVPSTSAGDSLAGSASPGAASTSSTPAPGAAPAGPTTKSGKKRLVPRPAGGSRHHTPVINLQAPTPRNPNGTAPGASDFAPPSGGPTAREAAAAFAGDEENPHPCPLTDCDKKFVRKSDFLRHYRIHTGERPFVCEIDNCGKSFIQRSALTVHQRVHSGEKPHACQDCGRLFSDSSSLARHRRIHAGLKPFACEMCGTKSFSRKATLTRHQNICPGKPEGWKPEPVIPKKPKKPGKGKGKAKSKKGGVGDPDLGPSSIDVSSHPLYNLHGGFPGASTPGTTSESGGSEADLAVHDPPHFDLSQLGSLPPYPTGIPGVDPAAAHNFRNSPALAASLALSPGPGGRANGKGASKAAGGKKGKGKATKGKGKKGKGKGKAKAVPIEDDDDDDAHLYLGTGVEMPPLPAFATGGLNLSLGGAPLPPLPPLSSFPPIPGAGAAASRPQPVYHDDSDECGSECDGECGRDKSDIEREERARRAAQAAAAHGAEDDEEDEEEYEGVPAEQAAAVEALVHGFGMDVQV